VHILAGRLGQAVEPRRTPCALAHHVLVGDIYNVRPNVRLDGIEATALQIVVVNGVCG
jgi:hypothetical protein